MTNADFLTYLRDKLATSKADVSNKELPQKEQTQAMIAVKLTTDSIKIMENCSGSAARRFKRDYLRRLAKSGVKL